MLRVWPNEQRSSAESNFLWLLFIPNYQFVVKTNVSPHGSVIPASKQTDYEYQELYKASDLHMLWGITDISVLMQEECKQLRFRVLI